MTDLQVTTLTGKESVLEEAAVNEFKASLRGPLLTPSNDGYDEARLIWNGMHDKRPALIARCSGVADVIAAVNFARTHHLLTAVRGGGHNIAGSGSCDGGIMIDLSLMKGIHVDPKSETARVQGGATLGDLDRETQVFGLATPAGNVSTTGVAGLTLGGGLGHLRRKFGLAIDNLESVDLVTADGQVLTVSKNENTELFWGIRGGGGNFGVVTSFEFRLHPVGPMVTLCAVWYPVDDAKAMLGKWRDFMGRDAPFLLSADTIWDDRARTDEVLACARAYLAEMEPYSLGGLYVNFAGLGEEGENLVKDAYGANYKRLVALKNKYDPGNLFRLNQNIKPTV